MKQFAPIYDDPLLRFPFHYVLLLKAGAINFYLLKPEEQDNILAAWGHILNGLSLPIQIIQKVRPSNLEDYFAVTKKKIARLKHQYPSAYEMALEHLELIIKETYRCNFLSREFYIALAVKTRDRETAWDTLVQEAAYLKREMQMLKIAVEIVDNPAREYPFLFPTLLQWNYLYAGGNFARTYRITKFPGSVLANWLEPLTRYPHSYTASLFIEPFSNNQSLKLLRRKYAKALGENLASQEENYAPSIILESKIETLERMQENLAKGLGRMFGINLFFTLEAKNLEALNSQSRQFEALLGMLNLEYCSTAFNALEFYRTAFPIGIHYEKLKAVDTEPLSSIFLFSNGDILDQNGICFGANEYNNNLILVDRWKYENGNMVVLGKNGSGKSFFVKSVIPQHMALGQQVVVLELRDEYSPLAPALGGKVISARDSINLSVLKDPFLVIKAHDDNEMIRGLAQLFDQIFAHKSFRVVIIDEAHLFLKHKLGSNLLARFSRECRKTGTVLTVVTQQVRDFLESSYGSTILNTCDIKVVFGLGDQDLKTLDRIYSLSNMEKFNLTLDKPGLGLVFIGNCRLLFNSLLTEREKTLFTTNPKDLLKEFQEAYYDEADQDI